MKRICGLCRELGNTVRVFNQGCVFVDFEFQHTQLQCTGSVGGEEGGQIEELSEQLLHKFSDSPWLEAMITRYMGGLGYGL